MLTLDSAATLRLKMQDSYIAQLVEDLAQRARRREGSYNQEQSCSRHLPHLSYPVTFGAIRLCILHKVRVFQVQPKVSEPCPLLHHVARQSGSTHVPHVLMSTDSRLMQSLQQNARSSSGQ